MSVTSCVIHFANKPTRYVYATRRLLKSFGIPNGTRIILAFGQTQVRAVIRQLNKKGKHLILPGSMRQKMNIPYTGQVMLKGNRRKLAIGPLIGIMTTINRMTPDQLFGGRTAFIKQLLKTGAKKGFCFAFTPQSISWHNNKVTGYYLSPDNELVKHIFPLPDVVYNRIPTRRMEKTSGQRAVKHNFAARGIPLFNWDFFDKWEVYDLLKAETAAIKYVAQTEISPTKEQIQEMLDTHQFIYLKPSGGSLGRGIMRLTKHPEKSIYYARFRRGNHNALLKFKTFSGLMKMIERRCGNLNNYIAQQGIRLIEMNRCPIDFRFHLTKNKHGEWAVAGIGAKKAGKGSVTTHVRTGGQLMTPEQALNHIYSEEKAAQLLNEAKQATIQLAEAIENSYPHPVGELGFDIGIDKTDAIWMFEANAKPGRSIFKHPELKQQGRETIAHIVDYCTYLSRFTEQKGDVLLDGITS